MSKKLTLNKVRKICAQRICGDCPLVIKNEDVLIGGKSICRYREEEQ